MPRTSSCFFPSCPFKASTGELPHSSILPTMSSGGDAISTTRIVLVRRHFHEIWRRSLLGVESAHKRSERIVVVAEKGAFHTGSFSRFSIGTAKPGRLPVEATMWTPKGGYGVVSPEDFATTVRSCARNSGSWV